MPICGVFACRCRWSTGSNGDIWVLQIEPDDSSSTAKSSSPKYSYTALPSDDVGPDGLSASSPSVVSFPRGGGEDIRSSSSTSSSAGSDRSRTALVDLSVAHVVECCRQPPWDQLVPVVAAGWQQVRAADMDYNRLCARRTSANWRLSSQSPAELQRLLHVTSV